MTSCFVKYIHEVLVYFPFLLGEKAKRKKQWSVISRDGVVRIVNPIRNPIPLRSCCCGFVQRDGVRVGVAAETTVKSRSV